MHIYAHKKKIKTLCGFYIFIFMYQQKGYRLFVTRSFIEGNRNLVYCPGAGCEFACEYTQVHYCFYYYYYY